MLCLVHTPICNLKIKELNKLEAFEMWIYRKMLKISWVDHITNEEVLRRINTKIEFLVKLKRQKISYFAHVMRGNKYELLQLIIEGKIEGKHGQIFRTWEWTDISNVGDLIHTATDRNLFQDIIACII